MFWHDLFPVATAYILQCATTYSGIQQRLIRTDLASSDECLGIFNMFRGVPESSGRSVKRKWQAEGRDEFALRNLVDTPDVGIDFDSGRQEGIYAAALDMVPRICILFGRSFEEGTQNVLRRDTAVCWLSETRAGVL